MTENKGLLDVYRPGSRVYFVDSKLEGIVNCVCLYAHGGVQYEIAYWHGGERYATWVNEQEIGSTLDNKRITQVGFKIGDAS